MWWVERLQFSTLLQMQICLETVIRAPFPSPALSVALTCMSRTGLCQNTHSVAEREERDLTDSAGGGKRRGSPVGNQAHPSIVSERDGIYGVVEGHHISLWTCIMQELLVKSRPEDFILTRNHFHKCSVDVQSW